jgi:hypothetical protein
VASPGRTRPDSKAGNHRLHPVPEAKLLSRLLTWVLTVCSVTYSSRAISAFDNPRATWRKVSVSRVPGPSAAAKRREGRHVIRS